MKLLIWLIAVFVIAFEVGCGSRSALEEISRPTGNAGLGGKGGASSGGTADAGGLGACRFGEEPVALVDDVADAHAIAIDDAFVYFTIATDGGSVRRVPKVGGPTEVLIAGLGRPRHLALDRTHVYVTSPMDGRVIRAAKNGVNPVELVSAPGHPAGIGVGTTTTFWVRAGPGAKAGALLYWMGVGSVETLATELDDPGPLTVENDEVFWIENSSGGTPAVWHLSFLGFAIPELLTTLPAANGNDIVADQTHVYYALNGELDRVPRSGGASETLATGVFIRGLALRDRTLYWVEGFDPTYGKVTRWELDAGTPETIATDQGGPVDVAVDEACVYWTNRQIFPGAVMARAR